MNIIKHIIIHTEEEKGMRIKRLIPTIGIVSIILCGCGQTQNTTISETTTEQATEITTTQEETTTEATTEITTEQVSEGVRENPCAVGYKEDRKLWICNSWNNRLF